MALSDDDVREILRLIDDAELDELRIETEGLSLHVVKGGSGRAVEPEAARSEQQRDEAPSAAVPAGAGGVTIEAPMIGVFYRAPSPGAPPFVDVGTRVERRHDRLPDRGDEDDELGPRGRRGHHRGLPRGER